MPKKDVTIRPWHSPLHRTVNEWEKAHFYYYSIIVYLHHRLTYTVQGFLSTYILQTAEVEQTKDSSMRNMRVLYCAVQVAERI
ncbi:hypothetical protein OUZ56_008147 [Daphnia magna]|uniref:Uncharacterized protein n=1 Tax=Daphnia magna TaxID=35525 RepID=A0ABR0AC34_9CRUS|nr:hypothetical protein OUZ56_008147 [Daphnia magna]